MISSSSPLLERGLDTMVLVYSLLQGHPALSACEQLGDEFSLAQAWNLLGRVQGSLMGAMTSAERAWRQALSYAERGNYVA